MFNVKCNNCKKTFPEESVRLSKGSVGLCPKCHTVSKLISLANKSPVLSSSFTFGSMKDVVVYCDDCQFDTNVVVPDSEKYIFCSFCQKKLKI